MADDIKITYNILVEDNDDPRNRYLLDNGLAKEGDTVVGLFLEDGDLILTRDINKIIQHIKTGLYLLIGDWVLDKSQGISYFTGMRAYPEVLSAQIKKAINSVDGVDTVLKYNFYQDNEDIIHISATVKVGNSEIAVNEQFKPTALGVA